MSTKVRAKIESVTGSTVTLTLESPFFLISPEGDEVFVELQTIHGSRIEFHVLESKPSQPKVPIPESTEEITNHEVIAEPIPDESHITDPSESVKETKASKKK